MKTQYFFIPKRKYFLTQDFGIVRILTSDNTFITSVTWESNGSKLLWQPINTCHEMKDVYNHFGRDIYEITEDFANMLICFIPEKFPLT